MAPAFLRRSFEQRRRWIDGEGATRQLQHREVVNGVAENRVGAGKSHAFESRGLGLVGGYVDDLAGNNAVLDSDLGCQNALDRNPEIAQALSDNPAIGGADGPEFDAGFAHPGYKREHLFENIL